MSLHYHSPSWCRAIWLLLGNGGPEGLWHLLWPIITSPGHFTPLLMEWILFHLACIQKLIVKTRIVKTGTPSWGWPHCHRVTREHLWISAYFSILFLGIRVSQVTDQLTKNQQKHGNLMSLPETLQVTLSTQIEQFFFLSRRIHLGISSNVYLLFWAQHWGIISQTHARQALGIRPWVKHCIAHDIESLQKLWR